MLMGATRPAAAQDMPGPPIQEVLIKSALVSLNDAVAANNFTVLHAKISKPFADQFPTEKPQAVFSDLVPPSRPFSTSWWERPINADEETKIDGQRRAATEVAISRPHRKQVKYQLGFMPADEARRSCRAPLNWI